MRRAALFSSFCLCLGAVPALAQNACPPPKAMMFTPTRQIRREVLSFTEGFEVHDGVIYESSGPLFGSTRLMRMTPTGQVSVLADFGNQFFGEGLTVLDDQIYQLSWKDHQVFVYDLNGRRLRSMRNNREGWGLTHEDGKLVFSDGSSHIYFADPRNFATLGSISVRWGRDPVENLNELEWVDGKIYANIFESRQIVRIDPATGCVEAEAEMESLWQQLSPADRRATELDGNFVLNGIAYDPDQHLFYLTGKEWPVVFAGRFSGG
jgi:glutamine cyclotransferase